MTNVRTSQLGAQVRVGLPDRYSGRFANPTGFIQRPNRTRETLALTSASPRMRHPKLNGSPWSTSYAVKRKPERVPARKARKG